MAQTSPKTPPPLPDVVDSGIDQKKLLTVIVMGAALAMVLLIALLALATGPNAGSGDSGSASGAGAGQSLEGSKTDGDEKGAAASESSADTGNDSPSDQDVVAGSQSEADAHDREPQTAEASQSQDSGNEPSAADSSLPKGISIEVPQSDRKVRNTFNPFGSNAPPKKTAQGQPSPVEVGKSAEFFGVAAEGKSFVYVVDKSSSMFIDKFDAARAELIESIDGLRPNQSFFVIFFDTSYYAQETDGLVKATARNKRSVKDWAMMAVSSGGTEPYGALEQAIELRPDAIFVLSDGDFSPYVITQVSQINSRFTIPIHTIAFTTNAQTLKELADQNRGRYRFVP